MTVKQTIAELQALPDDSLKFGYRHPDGSVVEAQFISVDEETGNVVAD